MIDLMHSQYPCMILQFDVLVAKLRVPLDRIETISLTSGHCVSGTQKIALKCTRSLAVVNSAMILC